MDSSRSGLLSTLLMTLPLIVVPAVALLRPPGQAGVSTAPLDAAEVDDVDAMFDDFEDFGVESSGAFKKEPQETDKRRNERDANRQESVEKGLLDEMDVTANGRSESSETRFGRPPMTSSDPFMDGSSAHDESRITRSESTSDANADAEVHAEKADAKKIVEQLNSLGALKTLWFAAGDKKPVGLAVFFRGDSEQTRIRFEAVGVSRDECAEDVLQQVKRWQQQNPQ